MKPITLQLANPQVVALACSRLQQLDLEQGWEVVIRLRKKSRSAAANALYWKWLTIFGADIGYTKDELHEMMKRKHLVPIFTRDDPEYAEMITALQGMPDNIKKQVVRLTSTTGCNVKQMSEYMNAVEAEARDLNISLPHPEDLYYEAMGIKRKESGNGK